jgi:hypothetical protein
MMAEQDPYGSNVSPGDHAAAAPARRGTPTAAVVIAWLVVGVPLLWGVSRTVANSMALFRAPAATQPTTAR